MEDINTPDYLGIETSKEVDLPYAHLRAQELGQWEAGNTFLRKMDLPPIESESEIKTNVLEIAALQIDTDLWAIYLTARENARQELESFFLKAE